METRRFYREESGDKERLRMNREWGREIEAQLLESAEVKRRMAEELPQSVIDASEAIVAALSSGGKVLLCGNGGSAADCQHIAGELVGRLVAGRERRPLPAVALTTDTSCLTALSNDYGFEQVFSRQVEALGNKGDILIAISTSGNSENVILAVRKAKEMGVKTIGFLGGTGGKLRDLVDLPIVVPSGNSQRIQEGHITMGHVVCDVVEQMLFAHTGTKAGP